MKWKLSRREQRSVLLSACVGLLGLWVYSVALLGPMWRNLGQLGQSVTTAQQELQVLESATANETALRQQYAQVKAQVASSRRRLPPEEELPATIERLTDLASQSGVKIQTIFPQRTIGDAQLLAGARGQAAAAARPAVFRKVPIEIDALAGYHQLGLFLSLVELEAHPMDLASLRITADPKEAKRHTIKLIIDAYFAPGTGDSDG